jgi:hypothetical protein
MSAIDKCETCPLLTSQALTPEQTERYLHYLEHGGENPLDALFPTASEFARVEKERDKAQKNYQFMVERACDEKLDGYRELGAKAAAAENALDSARARIAELESHCAMLHARLCHVVDTLGGPGTAESVDQDDNEVMRLAHELATEAKAARRDVAATREIETWLMECPGTRGVQIVDGRMAAIDWGGDERTVLAGGTTMRELCAALGIEVEGG